MSQNSEVDIQQLIEVIDRALTSKDERVINALRQLMMMVILTHPDSHDSEPGPLTEMTTEVRSLRKRMAEVEYELSRVRSGAYQRSYSSDKFEWPQSSRDIWNPKYSSMGDFIQPMTSTSIAEFQRKLGKE